MSAGSSCKTKAAVKVEMMTREMTTMMARWTMMMSRMMTMAMANKDVE